MPKNTRSNSQLLRCSIGKLDAPQAFQIGHEETPIPEEFQNDQQNPIPTERKPSVTMRKLTMRPFQPKPSIDDLLKDKNNVTPTEYKHIQRSNSRLLKCSIGKLDAPEAFQIGAEAPAAPIEKKPSANRFTPTESRHTQRSNSRLLKCSIGKLDAPEAFQIGAEAPAPIERKPSATIRKLTMRPFQPKPDFDEILKEYQDSSSDPGCTRS